MKPFRLQYTECQNLGLNKEYEFHSFKDNPNSLPLLLDPAKLEIFNQKLRSGEIQGFNIPKCGTFGGQCSSGNVECRKLRSATNENS